ncbi:MAG: ATP-binding protein [Ktedonobacterales bacterium]
MTPFTAPSGQPYAVQTAPRPVPISGRPLWARDLYTLYRGRIARQFVLHFNITDFVIDRDAAGNVVGVVDQPKSFREYLHQFLYEQLRCQAIYTYSLAGGLLADDREADGIGNPLVRELRGPAYQKLAETVHKLRPGNRQAGSVQPPASHSGQPSGGQEVQLPDTIPGTLKILGHMLRQPYFGSPSASGQPQREVPIAVILDFAEKLIPYHLGEGHGTLEQLQALEVMQSWALDPLIRQTNNLIMLLTANLGQLPAQVYAEGSGCRAIRVALPDESERRAFAAFKMQVANPKYRLVRLADEFGDTDDQRLTTFVRATQGMRLMDIDNVSRRATVECWNRGVAEGQERLSLADVQREKAEVIKSQSEQLLEVVPATRGFDEIGGLEELKAYLRTRTKLMLRGSHSPLIPSGLLLAGPPGTGKTIIAEALAMEGKFNLVKMRNIQDKWVGSSERNLDLVLHLLDDLHPVVVFIDEIDQAMGQRDLGQNLDSGVGARMFARILDVMSHAENRGKILWVAATNRPDRLDDALLRRFDRVVPLLAPDAGESRRIFAAMPGMISKQSGGRISVTYGGDLAQSGRTDRDGRLAPPPDDLTKFTAIAAESARLGLTGSEIEIVIRRAVEIACEQVEDWSALSDENMPPISSTHVGAAMADFKVNHNPLMYDYQSLLAIRACNFHSMVLKLPDRPVFRGLLVNGKIDQALLEQALDGAGSPFRTMR